MPIVEIVEEADAPSSTDSSTFVSDSELVECYLQSQSTAAFTDIVERHAQLVMGVCRRVLSRPEDAEDAFQATFLVLAQSAYRIRNRSSLASWLHGVAYRVSRRHASDNYRNRKTAITSEPMDETDEFQLVETLYERQLLDEELQRLADRYREVLVLRYLEGKTNQQISEIVGSSIGSVEGRLKRGKAELRRRLIRRGVTAMGVLIAVELSRETASAAVGSALIQQTVTAATSLSLSGSATPVSASANSPTVTSLAAKEIAAMSVSKIALITACVVLPITLMLPGDGGLTETSSLAMAQIGGFSSVESGAGRSDSKTKTVIETSVLQEKGQEFLPASGEISSPTKKEPFTIQIKDEKGTLMSLKMTQSQFEAVMSQLNKTMKVKDATGAPDAPAVNTPPDYSGNKESHRRIFAALEDETEIEFVETPLLDAMQYLSDLHNVPILVDKKALSDEGVAIDVPIDKVLTKITLEDGLAIALREHELTYIVKNNQLTITTQKEADTTFDTQVYEIRDLDIDSASLVEVIKEGTKATWKVNDRDGGTISEIPGALVIKQTFHGHREIERLLNQIRQHSANPNFETSKRNSGKPASEQSGLKPVGQSVPFPRPSNGQVVPGKQPTKTKSSAVPTFPLPRDDPGRRPVSDDVPFR